ncbi:MAG: hypothetical protein QOH03_1783 [Kribbellaceae bacterium]|jgi:hypothetical protein|nr:hypothetical protein [Kribbellaceae bacterium]
MSLLQWIAEVADDALVLDPAKPENELQNTWGFGCSEEERAELAVSDVVAASVLDDLVARRSVAVRRSSAVEATLSTA